MSGRRTAAGLGQRAVHQVLGDRGAAANGSCHRVQGMRFNIDNRLSLNVAREGTYLLVATSGGYAETYRDRGIPGTGSWR